MRNPKRWIAALLTAVMLFSALPGATFASEADEDGFQQEEQVAPAATPSEEEKSDFEAPPQDEDDLTSFISKDDDVYMLEDDTVTFNTQYMDIVVGHNVEKAEQGDTPYVLFADDGSYTIELYEEAPFFPYEVQFSYQGHTTSEWFMDENDCVIVGGHPFYVSCFGTPNHVGLLVSGEYVPAFPEQKEFVNDPYAAMPISLLPLREVSLSVDLKNYLPSELVKVGVNAVLTNQSITAGSAVVWAKGYRDDNFTVADMDAKLDLTPDSSYSSYVNLELIVGTADQLDTTNTRYIVSVEICSLDNLFAFNAYTTSGETLKVDRQYFDSYNGDPSYRLGIHEGTWTTGPTRLSMGWNSEFTGENGLTAVVYGGRYASEDELPQNGTVITDMWNASGASAHLADYSDRQNPPEFTLVLSRNGEIVQVIDFGIYMYVTSISISTSYCLYAESTSPYSTYRPQATSGGSRQEGNDYSTYVYTMWNGNPVNGSSIVFRLLSRSLDRWIMMSTADAICCRIASSGSPSAPCNTIVSKRLIMSYVEFAWPVDREPSCPVFMACSISKASAPRTSPTTMRSGRIRKADLIRSLIVIHELCDDSCQFLRTFKVLLQLPQPTRLLYEDVPIPVYHHFCDVQVIDNLTQDPQSSYGFIDGVGDSPFLSEVEC